MWHRTKKLGTVLPSPCVRLIGSMRCQREQSGRAIAKQAAGRACAPCEWLNSFGLLSRQHATPP